MIEVTSLFLLSLFDSHFLSLQKVWYVLRFVSPVFFFSFCFLGRIECIC